MVGLLLRARRAASEAIFSKMSLMKEFMMDIALEEIPVSGSACLGGMVTSVFLEWLAGSLSAFSH